MKANILRILLTLSVSLYSHCALAAAEILTIDTAKGPQHFAVELALSPDQQEQGLMQRPSLAARGGMLFPFARERRISIWMRDTMIPLDIVFIRKDGIIIHIAKNAVPYSLKKISSGKPVLAVLELKGGISDSLSIAVGNKVHYASFFK
jgi:uncharacterized membrane protein (UPF0127 family)